MTISGFAAYVKQLWKNKPDTSTPLSAARLLHLEDGIKGSSDAIEKIATAVVSQIINDPNKIASMAALYAVNQNLLQLNSDLHSSIFSNADANIYNRMKYLVDNKKLPAEVPFCLTEASYGKTYITGFMYESYLYGSFIVSTINTSANNGLFRCVVDNGSFKMFTYQGAAYTG